MQVRDQAVQEAMGRRLVDHMTGGELLLHARFAAALKERETALRRQHTEALGTGAAGGASGKGVGPEVVSPLRGDAWTRYRTTAAHEVQVAMDEVAGAQHNRRRAESGE